MEECYSCALLGQLLVAEGVITPEELREALNRQRESPAKAGLLGAILLDMGCLARRQLDRALQAQAEIRGQPAPSRPQVLVVEDDPEQSAALRDILAGAGYRVRAAQSEGEALGIILASNGNPPDLLVLDLCLPVHGGIELLTVLRKNGSTHGMPVVVLSERPDLAAEIQERGLPISSFITTPVSAKHLVEAAQAALQDGQRTRELAAC